MKKKYVLFAAILTGCRLFAPPKSNYIKYPAEQDPYADKRAEIIEEFTSLSPAGTTRFINNLQSVAMCPDVAKVLATDITVNEAQRIVLCRVLGFDNSYLPNLIF